MEYQKITKLLGSTSNKVTRFITKKWIEVFDQSGGAYNTNKQVRFKTSMLRSDLCDYNDAYIAVKGTISVSSTAGFNEIRDKKSRPLAFKNNAPIINCILKTNGTLVENAEDLDIVMLMYNLLEDSKNCSKTSGSLWNYYRDELSDETNDNNGPNKDTVNSNSFKYKTSITGSTYNLTDVADDYDANKKSTKEAEIVVPLKCLGKFWKTLDMPLINCEVSLVLTWSADCVITSLHKISNSCKRR